MIIMIIVQYLQIRTNNNSVLSLRLLLLLLFSLSSFLFTVTLLTSVRNWQSGIPNLWKYEPFTFCTLQPWCSHNVYMKPAHYRSFNVFYLFQTQKLSSSHILQAVFFSSASSSSFLCLLMSFYRLKPPMPSESECFGLSLNGKRDVWWTKHFTLHTAPVGFHTFQIIPSVWWFGLFLAMKSETKYTQVLSLSTHQHYKAYLLFSLWCVFFSLRMKKQ